MNPNTAFTLKILDQHWIKNEGDDPKDLCSHGYVYLQIGNEVLCDQEVLDVTTSAASLHLMRTLNQDYSPGNYSGQLLPCCGFFITMGKDPNMVEVHGCINGIDWKIEHLEGGLVKHTTTDNVSVIIDINDYKSQILSFADAVAHFYKSSRRKVLPVDDFERNGYEAFWSEWHNLRQQWI